MLFWYKLTVSYDGTNYHGWQWQPHQASIERTLKETFLGVFKQKELYLVGASRTDAGVHANGQVVRLGTHINLAPKKLQTVLNDALPSDIVIQSTEIVDQNFHPQHGIKEKIYQYRIFTERPHPTIQRYGWYVKEKINLITLRFALEKFIGTHDFTAFCKESGTGKNTVKTIDNYGLEFENEEIIITIVGKSFLHHMIRRIIGAAVHVASNKNISPNLITQTLQTKKMSKELPTAPAKGLCLHSIEYTYKQ